MNEQTKPLNSRRGLIIFLSILVPALFFLAWSQASLNLSFIRPSNATQLSILLALSAFIFVAFVIFALILARTLLKLYVERRQQQLGAKFKTRMVVAFLALSLLPVCFLFFFAYGLLNHSIDRWFGTPFDVVRKDATEIVRQLKNQEQQQALHDAEHLSTDLELRQKLVSEGAASPYSPLVRQLRNLGLEGALCFDRRGGILTRVGRPEPAGADILRLFPVIGSGQTPREGLSALWHTSDAELALAVLPVFGPGGERLGTAVSVRRIPVKMTAIVDEIQREVEKYNELSHERKVLRLNYLAVLGLVTLLILFAATWLALFLSKQVTVPIQALAAGTHEVAKGNLEYQVKAPASGELRTLIRSFNEMTRQLQENRRAIEQAAHELQRANRELEERGNTMEAILESIPTAVVSFDPAGQITRLNPTAERMFRALCDPRSAGKLADLFSPEDAHEVTRLFRQARRQGVTTQMMELDLDGRRAVVALTVSSIRARHGAVGSLLILEDLTELLRAQKSAAWQEVAQRLAHEIKNPLTPIQLSAERIRRLVERAEPGALPRDLATTVRESAALIGREVGNLKTMVDEFSAFARFPVSQPVPSSLNGVVENALHVFDGRLNGIRVHQDLASDLPPIHVDPAQMGRAVANLIDNAAEAIEQSVTKEIWVRTALDGERDLVEIVIADSGPGIAPEAKEKLFLPYFSTKQRGTGLGLAIVSRIVSEHKGTIRVEENRPTGSKFVIELPVDRQAVAHAEG